MHTAIGDLEQSQDIMVEVNMMDSKVFSLVVYIFYHEYGKTN